MQECVYLIENEFKRKNILVIGDLMVDEYVTGKVKRISPEAPVPVLSYTDITRTAGGAANVVKNVKALGANVWAVGVAAKDEPGRWLRKHLEDLGVFCDCIISDNERPTIIKTRYAANGQQLLRVDNEECGDISSHVKEEIFSYLKSVLTQLDAVILSDYCKGTFDDGSFVRDVIRICVENNVFVSIDSKSKAIENFAGANFVKPNNLELEAAVGVRIDDEESLDTAGKIYLRKSGIHILLVTRGASGISVFQKGKERQDFAADHEVQVYDVTGAGDTVISTASLALVSGLPIDKSMYLANLAAGIVISKVGTVAIEWKELLENVKEKQNL